MSGSVWRSTHLPLHGDSPAEHWPLTGKVPELWELPVLLFMPADSGETVHAENAVAAIMRIILINPSTRTGDRITVFGRGSDCTKGTTGRKGGAFLGFTGSEGRDGEVTGTCSGKMLPQVPQKTCPRSFELLH